MTARVCTVDGCDRPPHAKGWCASHYAAQRRKVDPAFAERQRAQWRAKAARRNARQREQARVYRELLEHGQLPR